MKGAFFLGNREFEVRDMEKRPLAADEVRIRVMACGVCGTDVHIYHGEAGSAEVTPPVVLGHEYAGRRRPQYLLRRLHALPGR